MRHLLTIFHYELLLQLKSIRFKATCLLAGLIAFGFYTDGVRFQRLPEFSDSLLSFESLPTYLIAIAFTGLFAIGRIRAAGMHPILMTKPFPTFTLLLGQLLAGLVALLIPLAILYFPPGLILHGFYDMEFAPLPIFHAILFFMIPLICSVLAVTIWLRTCFKNNLVAIIILALVFAACAMLSDRFLTASSEGMQNGAPTVKVHRFVPMISYFSKTYWNGQMQVFKQPKVVFTRSADWINWATSILYCNVFLMLGGYHLRRTEPQRKVLGSYGRHWYHTPTFLKIACDLKIDPQVTWRHHLILAAMLGAIFFRTVWPMLPDDARSLVAQINPTPVQNDPYDESRFPAEKILKMRVHADRQLLTPEHYISDMTVSILGDTSGTMAILYTIFRSTYDLRAISLDSKPLPFIKRRWYYFIEGKDLKPFADSHTHQLHCEAFRSTTQDAGAMSNPIQGAVSRGYMFMDGKRTVTNENGASNSYFSMSSINIVPVHLTLERPANERLLDAPTSATITRAGSRNRYDFTILPDKTGTVMFDSSGDYVVIEPVNKSLNFRMSVPEAYQATARDVMELAEPVLQEFYELRNLVLDRPVLFISPAFASDDPLLKNLRRYQNIYRYRGYLMDHEKQEMTRVLNEIENRILTSIFESGGWFHSRGHWDLYAFFRNNLTRGLNHRISLERAYEPPDFKPINAHLAPDVASKLKDRNREQCIEQKSDWPVFQMLYLVLGHEKWQAMFKKFRATPLSESLTIDQFQQLVESAAGEPLGWFFDYWMRTGRDLPCYQVVSASAKQVYAGPDDKPEYAVKVVVKNLGTGRMPVPLVLSTSKNPIEEKVWIGDSATATWTVQCKDMPKKVEVDPAGWIMTKPYWVEKNRTWVSNAAMNVKIE